MHKDINVNVSGPVQPTSTYKTKVLKGNHSFASQVTEPNTKYVIKHDFVLDGDVTIPANCVLEFDVGCLSNGTVLNCGKIINLNDSVIFNNITFINPAKQEVKLKWFNNGYDADSLVEAAKFQIVDAEGNWTLNKTAYIYNDLKLFNGTFNGVIGIFGMRISSQDTYDVNYAGTIDKHAKSITVNVPKFYKYVLIKSTDKYYWTENEHNIRHGNRGELMEINNIDNDTITFSTTSGTILEYTENITLHFFNPITVDVDNIRMIANTIWGEDSSKIHLLIGGAHANVRNSYFKGLSVGVALASCYNSIIDNCEFEEIYPWATSFSDGTAFSSVCNCRCNGHRHLWTTLDEKTVCKYNIITGNVCKRCTIGITPHANAYATKISNNIVSDCDMGIGSYAPCSIIENNTIYDAGGGGSVQTVGIILTEAGIINPVVRNNTIINRKYAGTAIRISDLHSGDIYYITPSSIIIENNVIQNVEAGGGIIITSETYGGVINTQIVGNNFNNIDYQAIRVTGASFCNISGNSINNVTRNLNAISITANTNIPLADRKIFITNNTFFDAGRAGLVSVSDMNEVYFTKNTGIPFYTPVFTNCTNVHEDYWDLPNLSPTQNGIAPSYLCDDIINLVSNGSIKLATVANKYQYIKAIISVSTESQKAGSIHLLSITGTTSGTPRVRVLELLDDSYVDLEVYVDTEGNVYLNNVQLVRIKWLAGQDRRNPNINNKITIPAEASKVGKQSLVYTKRGTSNDIPTEVDNDIQPFYRTDINKLTVCKLGTSNTWVDTNGYTPAAKYGAFANKPTMTGNDVGYQYFNTDTNKMITWDGTKWYNPDGTEAVS